MTDARFHVTEFRGFERFCQGRPFWEMAGLSARICGICPVSHLAGLDEGGRSASSPSRFRRPPSSCAGVMNLAQFIQSHALSFFHLSAPDLLLGWESDPAKRNLFGLIEADPRAGPRRHSLAAIRPGDHRGPGRPQDSSRLVRPRRRARLPRPPKRATASAARLPEAFAVAHKALEIFKEFLDTHAEETQVFGNFPSLFMGLVTSEGDWENYDGWLRFMDHSGTIVDAMRSP